MHARPCKMVEVTRLVFMLVMVGPVLLDSPAAPAGEPRGWNPLVNVAAASEGGVAVALFSQSTFDAMLAVDGDFSATRGWAYHGRLQAAAIVFAFDGAHDVSRVHMASGLSGSEDHHITAFQLWVYYPHDLAPAPPPEAGPASSVSYSVISAAIRQRERSESANLRNRLAEHEVVCSAYDAVDHERPSICRADSLASDEGPFHGTGWTLVRDVKHVVNASGEQVSQKNASGIISAAGAPEHLRELQLQLATTRAIAIKLVVLDADSPTKNAVLTEMEVFAERHVEDEGGGQAGEREEEGRRRGNEVAASCLSGNAPVVVRGGAEAPLALHILSPQEGATLMRAPLRVEVSGAVFGDAGAHILVMPTPHPPSFLSP